MLGDFFPGTVFKVAHFYDRLLPFGKPGDGVHQTIPELFQVNSPVQVDSHVLQRFGDFVEALADDVIPIVVLDAAVGDQVQPGGELSLGGVVFAVMPEAVNKYLGSQILGIFPVGDFFIDIVQHPVVIVPVKGLIVRLLTIKRNQQVFHSDL